MLARIGIRQLPIDERKRRRGEQVCSGNPRVSVDALKVLDHLGQRGRDDGLIQGGQEQRHEDRQIDDRSVTVGHRRLERPGLTTGHYSGPTHRDTNP